MSNLENIQMRDCLEAKGRNLIRLLSRQNVVACGVGFKESGGETTDELCVAVSVTKKMPKAQLSPADIVPRKLGQVKTDVVETGVIRALRNPLNALVASSLRHANLQSRTDRWRPAPGGVSIGHIDVSAGTLGCLVTRNGERFILSNNHVLANSNAAQRGDPILQPGRHDGGTLADQIATLEDFIPLDFGDASPTCPIATGVEGIFNWLANLLGSKHRARVFRETLALNRVDAAIARPLSEDLLDERILEIGMPKGSGEAALGTKVRKSGRTTGLTTGQITQVDVTVRVGYEAGKTAVFEDQLMAGAMSQGGDSGSVVLDEEGFVVGLLFAGSDATTVISPIQFVLDALNVEIVTAE